MQKKRARMNDSFTLFSMRQRASVDYVILCNMHMHSTRAPRDSLASGRVNKLDSMILWNLTLRTVCDIKCCWLFLLTLQLLCEKQQMFFKQKSLKLQKISVSELYIFYKTIFIFIEKYS